MLASRCPAPNHRERMHHYAPYLCLLNLEGLTFPLPVPEIHKFEAQNPFVIVNVYYFLEKEKEIIPIIVTKHVDRQYHVNLLLLANDTQRHYILITRMSALVCHRSNFRHKVTVCWYCVRPFGSQEAHDRHIENCKSHQTTATEYP
jgi:hypothetical protein